nr:momilactone A synthase [Ipomoea batatas]
MLPPGPAIPALLNMISSLPLHSTASFTADSTSASFETSQWTYRPPIDSASGAPSSSSMSAMITSTPFPARSFAVSAPIPLAPPDLLGIPAEDLYEKNLNNLGHVKEILGLKGRTMLFKISAKKEHYVRRNVPFPVVKIKTNQLLLQQLCPDLLALDENEFNSDGPSSEEDDKFLEHSRTNGSTLMFKLSTKWHHCYSLATLSTLKESAVLKFEDVVLAF